MDTIDDEVAVRALMRHLTEAWDAGDADRYAAIFTADADYTAFDGTVMRGQKQISAGHVPLFAGIMKGSRLVHESIVVRIPCPGCAIITARGGIIMSWQRRRTTASRKRFSALTMVAIQRDDNWALTAFQNTRYRPWNRSALGRLMTVLYRRQLEDYRAASVDYGKTDSVV